MLAGDIRKRRVRTMCGLRHWHVDEMVAKVNGVMIYLWPAVDHDGEILESFVTKKWDKAAALAFITKTSRRTVEPSGSLPTA